MCSNACISWSACGAGYCAGSCTLWRTDLRPLENEPWDEDGGGSLPHSPEVKRAVKYAPHLISALNDELKLVKSEKTTPSPHDTSAVANTHTAAATDFEIQDDAVEPARPPAHIGRPNPVPVQHTLQHSGDDLPVDDVSLWLAPSTADPSASDLRDVDMLLEEQDAKKQDRHTVEERARNLLRQDLTVLHASAATDNNALFSEEWDEITEGWERAEADTSSTANTDEGAVHVPGAGSGAGSSAVGVSISGGGSSASAPHSVRCKFSNVSS